MRLPEPSFQCPVAMLNTPTPLLPYTNDESSVASAAVSAAVNDCICLLILLAVVMVMKMAMTPCLSRTSSQCQVIWSRHSGVGLCNRISWPGKCIIAPALGSKFPPSCVESACVVQIGKPGGFFCQLPCNDFRPEHVRIQDVMSVFEPKPPADLATELLFLEGSVRARSSILCGWRLKFVSRMLLALTQLPFKDKYRQLLHRIGALCEARGVALPAFCSICHNSLDLDAAKP